MTDSVSAWVARFASAIPQGEVLDLACGGGRHSRLLAALDHPVLAVDRDVAALVRVAAARITTLEIDLEQGAIDNSVWPFAEQRFSGIVVTNYLHRPLFSLIAKSLAPGGVLIYETFALGNEHFGKPTNPNFLLKPAELLNMAQEHGLQIVAFEEGYVELPKPAMTQRLCAAQPI